MQKKTKHKPTITYTNKDIKTKSKKYIDISRIIENAIKRYKSEVIKKRFPTRKHSFNT